ncbi:MAG TPA: GGDEF domain-containing protein [Bacilli bacterium]
MLLTVDNDDLFGKLEFGMEKGFMGLIYLDIAMFSEMKDKHGSRISSSLIELIRKTIGGYQGNKLSLFVQSSLEDDFFIYIQTGMREVEKAQLLLQKEAIVIKAVIEERMLTEVPILSEVQLHMGTSLLLNRADQKIRMVVYSAMKHAIRVSKQYKGSVAYLKELHEFNDILANQKVSTVFQPIVSLYDAGIFGYEALTRGPVDSCFHSPLALFEFAEQEGSVYELDKMVREKAIQGCQFLKKDQRIFINIPAHIINDPQFTTGHTQTILQQYGLSPTNVVLEITERSSIIDFPTVKKILEHYRNQGYQIAIDDAGAGYSSLQAIAELQPDFIKIDRSLICDIHKDKIKENILKTMITFAQKMNIHIIAEGIEQMDELEKLIRMGIPYAQGYLLGRPDPIMQQMERELAEFINDQKRSNMFDGNVLTIGHLSAPVNVIPKHTFISEVANFIKNQEDSLGTAVVQNDIPVGLIMREKLYRLLSEQYGIALYWNRTVDKIMDPHPMIVDENLAVEQVAQMAMSRETNKLYDFVIITRQGKMAGAASIRSILECITNERMENARVASPLTGLPGNIQIQREINKQLMGKGRFSVIYADLDYFKWFNDRFGFQKGDQVIQFTADVLQQVISVCGQPNDFTGHIGGDDFIVISTAENTEIMCEEIIRRFEQGVTVFHEGEEWSVVEDRHGNEVESDSVTISLSLIVIHSGNNITAEQISQSAASLKKIAKAHKGSIFCAREMGEAHM